MCGDTAKPRLYRSKGRGGGRTTKVCICRFNKNKEVQIGVSIKVGTTITWNNYKIFKKKAISALVPCILLLRVPVYEIYETYFLMVWKWLVPSSP